VLRVDGRELPQFNWRHGRFLRVVSTFRDQEPRGEQAVFGMYELWKHMRMKPHACRCQARGNAYEASERCPTWGLGGSAGAFKS